MQFSSNYQPVCQWSRPQPVQPWPTGWSSLASSAWTPCPPETPLRSPWCPLPHFSGSHAPWTRSGWMRRPIREICWLLGEMNEENGRSFAAKKFGKGTSGLSSYHKAMVIHVKDEVLAHDSQTNEGNVCSVRTRNNHIYWLASGHRLNINDNELKIIKIFNHSHIRHHYISHIFTEILKTWVFRCRRHDTSCDFKAVITQGPYKPTTWVSRSVSIVKVTFVSTKTVAG